MRMSPSPPTRPPQPPPPPTRARPRRRPPPRRRRSARRRAAATCRRAAPEMLQRASWPALGTSVDLLVLDGDHAAARVAVESLLDEVDRTYSRFRADSELRKLRPEPEHPTPVSPLLALALETALEA